MLELSKVPLFRLGVSRTRWRSRTSTKISSFSKRDANTVLREGPRSFDRNLLILERVSGEEQPSDLEMHYGIFWVRIYDLPLKPRSDSMAKKLGDIIGAHLENDPKESNHLGRFLRVKVSIDLRKPLKRGTLVRYQGRSLKVYLKYERLPTFCFVCGRIGHQVKDCEEVEDQEDGGYEELDENEHPHSQKLWENKKRKVAMGLVARA